jgi:pyrophosphatase PpaX
MIPGRIGLTSNKGSMTSATIKRAVLLDLDGTVVDTHELIFQSYDWTMRQHCGCEGSRQILEACTGLPLREIFAATLEHARLPVADAVLTNAIIHYRQHLKDNEKSVTTFPGMRSTLIELTQRGWRLGIVTTKGAEGALRHLTSQDLIQFFGSVVTGDQCQNLKPHPEPFQTALKALNVRPENALGVGDTEHDIVSARAAGLVSVAACWGTLSRGRLVGANPDFVIGRPEELLSLPFSGVRMNG